jgi:hypothetical protein
MVVARRGLATEESLGLGWDAFALRGCIAALLAALTLMVLMVLAGGAAGPGRMAEFGIPGALPAAGVLGAGMAIGAAASAGLLAARRPAETGADAGR